MQCVRNAGEAGDKEGEKMHKARENPGYVDSEYLQMLAELTQHVKQRSYALMHIQRGHAVLDVGCGPATDTISLAHLVGPGGQVYGVDYDHAMITEANLKATEASVAGWTMHKQSDATSLPFESGCVDSCRSERVFQHVSNPEHILAEMTRVTQSGGWIVVIDTDFATLSVDGPDLDIERRLMQVKVEKTLNNGAAGRQLFRLFRQQGLVDLTVELFAFPFTNYPLARQTFLFDRLAETAREAGAITPEEQKRWQASLEQADREGIFFASATQVMVAGRKP